MAGVKIKDKYKNIKFDNYTLGNLNRHRKDIINPILLGWMDLDLKKDLIKKYEPKIEIPKLGLFIIEPAKDSKEETIPQCFMIIWVNRSKYIYYRADNIDEIIIGMNNYKNSLED